MGSLPNESPPVKVAVEAELYGLMPAGEAQLQRDTEARLDVLQNILDQWRAGCRTWREAAAACKAIAERLPDWRLTP